jgi:hypothetical protein
VHRASVCADIRSPPGCRRCRIAPGCMRRCRSEQACGRLAAQVVELALGALPRAVDSVENLKAARHWPAGNLRGTLTVAGGAERYDHVGEEREEVVGLGIKAEGVKGPKA